MGATARRGSPLLPLATWAKWGALCIAGATLGLVYRTRAPVLAGAGGLFAVTAAAAWVVGSPWLGEAMGLAVVVLYAAVMVRSLRDPWPPSPPRPDGLTGS